MALALSLDSWFLRHLSALKTVMRIIFGVVWGIDGALKFQPGLSNSIVELINKAGEGQPGWLMPWFNFWSSAVSTNPGLYVNMIGLSELALSLAVIFGFLRKVAYTAGFFLSLVIWSVPEGFGGPYGPGSTDIGTGVIYSFVFLLLLIVNAAFGPSKISLDYAIEKRFPRWKRIAEIRSK